MNFLFKKSKSILFYFFFAGGRIELVKGRGGWSKLIFLTMNPNLNKKIYFCGGRGRGEGQGGLE